MRYELASCIYQRGSEISSTGGLLLFFIDTPGSVCLKTPLSSLLITSLALRKISSFPFQMSLCYLFVGSLPTKKLDLNFFFHTNTQTIFSNKKSEQAHFESEKRSSYNSTEVFPGIFTAPLSLPGGGCRGQTSRTSEPSLTLSVCAFC